MEFCSIEVYSHFFKITNASPEFAKVIADFAWKATSMKLSKQGRRFINVPDKTYAWRGAVTGEFRFHVNHLPEFKLYCVGKQFKLDESSFIYHDMYEPAKGHMKLSPSWKARPNQIPVIDYILAEGSCKTVTLQTGQGKTSCSLKAGERYGKRMLIAVLGRYYDKWVTDVAGQYGLANEEVYFARGTKEFKRLLARSTCPSFNPEVIIVTIGTILSYIKEYGATGLKGQPDYCCPPEKIWEQLGIGFRIIDEVHQHFHTVYTIDLHTHMPKCINLSATLKADKPLIQRMYDVAFPMSTRINGGKYIKVADCKAIHYNFLEPKPIRYNGFAKSYSHVVFEESLVKQKKAWGNYLDLILELTVEHYDKIAKEGQKMLIFAAKVETCELIKEYLELSLPHRVVEKYTSEDDYETFETADIVVSTIGSSGTAIDIPGLITTLMTTCINSTSANEQALGRLRDLRIPGFNPLFLYFVCDDIPKQKEYAENKMKKFEDMVFTHKNIYYGKKL